MVGMALDGNACSGSMSKHRIVGPDVGTDGTKMSNRTTHSASGRRVPFKEQLVPGPLLPIVEPCDNHMDVQMLMCRRPDGAKVDK